MKQLFDVLGVVLIVELVVAIIIRVYAMRVEASLRRPYAASIVLCLAYIVVFTWSLTEHGQEAGGRLVLSRSITAAFFFVTLIWPARVAIEVVHQRVVTEQRRKQLVNQFAAEALERETTLAIQAEERAAALAAGGLVIAATDARQASNDERQGVRDIEQDTREVTQNMREATQDERTVTQDTRGTDQDARTAKQNRRGTAQDARTVGQDERTVEQDGRTAKQNRRGTAQDARTVGQDERTVEQDGRTAEQDGRAAALNKRTVEQDERLAEGTGNGGGSSSPGK